MGKPFARSGFVRVTAAGMRNSGLKFIENDFERASVLARGGDLRNRRIFQNLNWIATLQFFGFLKVPGIYWSGASIFMIWLNKRFYNFFLTFTVFFAPVLCKTSLLNPHIFGIVDQIAQLPKTLGNNSFMFLIAFADSVSTTDCAWTKKKIKIKIVKTVLK